MKKVIVLSVGLMLVLMSFVLAGNPKDPADSNGLNKGKSDMRHLYLYEKYADDWAIVSDGAWGKMSFDSDSFVFNAHGLGTGENYTLIRYKDPWSGSPVCLANGVSNNGGNINLAREMVEGGPKVWLVLSADVDCLNHAMIGWNPSEYLFEYNLINRSMI